MYIVLFLVAILSFSQAAALSRLSAAPPELICFWRLSLASLIMGGLARFKGERLTQMKQLPSSALIYIVLSGLFLWLHLWCFQFAAQNTPIANLMIIFATNPIFTGIISVVFLKIPLQKHLIPAYLVAFFGIYILVSQNVKIDPKNAIGNWTSLGASLFFSLYIICGHQSRKQITNSTFTFYIYAIAAFCFMLTTGARGKSFFDYPAITWIAIAALILFPTLLGHALFTFLLKHLNVNWMSTGKLAEPLFASISAYFFFHEVWSGTTAIAFSCTVLSLLMLLTPWKYLRRV